MELQRVEEERWHARHLEALGHLVRDGPRGCDRHLVRWRRMGEIWGVRTVRPCNVCLVGRLIVSKAREDPRACRCE